MRPLDRLIFAAIAFGLFANAFVSFPIARAAYELGPLDIANAVHIGVRESQPIHVQISGGQGP